MRGMVMQTLRSPSLDTRLARLEDRLDAAGVPGAGTGRPVSPVRSWRAWLARQGGRRSAKLRRAVLVPLIVMALLVVIWAGVTFFRHDGGWDALFGGTEEPAPEGAASDPARDGPIERIEAGGRAADSDVTRSDPAEARDRERHGERPEDDTAMGEPTPPPVPEDLP